MLKFLFNKVADLPIMNMVNFSEHLMAASESSQQAFTCSKLTIKTLEQGVKYVQG